MDDLTKAVPVNTYVRGKVLSSQALLSRASDLAHVPTSDEGETKWTDRNASESTVLSPTAETKMEFPLELATAICSEFKRPSGKEDDIEQLIRTFTLRSLRLVSKTWMTAADEFFFDSTYVPFELNVTVGGVFLSEWDEELGKEVSALGSFISQNESSLAKIRHLSLRDWDRHVFCMSDVYKLLEATAPSLRSASLCMNCGCEPADDFETVLPHMRRIRIDPSGPFEFDEPISRWRMGRNIARLLRKMPNLTQLALQPAYVTQALLLPGDGDWLSPVALPHLRTLIKRGIMIDALERDDVAKLIATEALEQVNFVVADSTSFLMHTKAFSSPSSSLRTVRMAYTNAMQHGRVIGPDIRHLANLAHLRFLDGGDSFLACEPLLNPDSIPSSLVEMHVTDGDGLLNDFGDEIEETTHEEVIAGLKGKALEKIVVYGSGQAFDESQSRGVRHLWATLRDKLASANIQLSFINFSVLS